MADMGEDEDAGIPVDAVVEEWGQGLAGLGEDEGPVEEDGDEDFEDYESSEELSDSSEMSEDWIDSPRRFKSLKWVHGVCGHSAVACGDFLLVLGGYGHANSYRDPGNLYALHVPSGQWLSLRSRGRAPPKHCGAAAVLLRSSLFVFGGFTSSFLTPGGASTSTLHALHLPSLRWELVDPRPTGLQPHCLNKHQGWTYKGRLYFFAGYGPLPARHNPNTTLPRGLPNGEYKVDLESGLPNMGWNNHLLVFDPLEGTWTNPETSGDVPSPRAAHAALLLPSGEEVAVFGGRSGSRRLGDLYVLRLDSLVWRRVSTTSFVSAAGGAPAEGIPGRSWAGLSHLPDGRLVVAGGYGASGELLQDVWLERGSELRDAIPRLAEPRIWGSLTAFPHLNAIVAHGGAAFDFLSNSVDVHEAGTYHADQERLFRCGPPPLGQLAARAVADALRRPARQLRQRHWQEAEEAALPLPPALLHKVRFLHRPAAYLRRLEDTPSPALDLLQALN